MATGLNNPRRSVTLSQGINTLNTGRQSVPTPTFYGRTLVNLLGNDGGCESTSPFTTVGTVATSTTQVKSGTTSIKFTSSGSSSYAYKDYTLTLNTTKQYVVGAWVFIESYTSGDVALKVYDSGTLSNQRYAINANTSTIGSWQFVYVKIPTSNTIIGTGFRMFFGGATSATSVAYIDSIRLYELDSTTYNAIGSTITTTSAPSIADILPYVDNVKHLVNPYVVRTGKNLLPPFAQWTLNANAIVNSAYSMTLNATTSSQPSDTYLKVTPFGTYTMSFTQMTGRFAFYYYANDDFTGLIATSSYYYTTSQTIIVPNNCRSIMVRINSTSVGTFYFTNPQLELGSIATPFEAQRTDSFSATTTLASSIDGSVRDSLTLANGVWTKTKRWQTDYPLDGNLTYSYWADAVGFKRVRIQGYSPNISNPTTTQYTTFSCVKFDGKILIGQATATSADSVAYDGSNTGFFISVSDIDSGWGESYIPSATEIKAYFLGYKMNNGTFGTAYDGTGTKTWTTWNATSNTGAVTTTPTTQASGFTPYKLSYQLETPTTETPTTSGSITLDNCVNTLDIGASSSVSAVNKYAVTTNPKDVGFTYTLTSGNLRNRMESTGLYNAIS